MAIAHQPDECDCQCEVEYEVQSEEPDVKRGAGDPDFGDKDAFLRILRDIENVQKYEEE